MKILKNASQSTELPPRYFKMPSHDTENLSEYSNILSHVTKQPQRYLNWTSSTVFNHAFPRHLTSPKGTRYAFPRFWSSPTVLKDAFPLYWISPISLNDAVTLHVATEHPQWYSTLVTDTGWMYYLQIRARNQECQFYQQHIVLRRFQSKNAFHSNQLGTPVQEKYLISKLINPQIW